jgi:hypothetical protein
MQSCYYLSILNPNKEDCFSPLTCFEPRCFVYGSTCRGNVLKKWLHETTRKNACSFDGHFRCAHSNEVLCTQQTASVHTFVEAGRSCSTNKKAQMTVVLSVLYLKAPPNSTSAEAKEWLGVVGKRNEDVFPAEAHIVCSEENASRFPKKIFSSCALISKNKFLVGIQLRIL